MKKVQRKKVVQNARVKRTTKKEKVTTTSPFTLRDSYASMLLGAIVVVVASIFLVWFVQSRKTAPTQDIASTRTEQQTVEKKETEESSPTVTVSPTKIPSGIPQAKRPASLPETYSVTDGDNLWSIAEKLYGSGYNWVDIARENNLDDASYITVGMKLNIPNVAKKMISATSTSPAANGTIAQNGTTTAPANGSVAAPVQKSITGDSYIITRGDDLWDIAVRAYGDGYKWVDIAQANGLSNPGLIHSDNVLKIPR